MRSPRVASPGSAIAREPGSKSIAIARGRMRFIVSLHRFLGCSFKNGRVLTAERRARELWAHARRHIFRETSGPRRSEGRTARLRREWIGGKRRRHLRKGRRKYDDRRCAQKAEALERAGCHGSAIIHGLLARIGLVRTAVGHVLRHGDAFRLRRFHAHASATGCRQHRDRQGDQKRYNGASDAHGWACVKIAGCSRSWSSDDFASRFGQWRVSLIVANKKARLRAGPFPL